MPQGRPEIPAEVKRQLMIECGHRCACCGEATSLEKAHIIPWSEKKEHKVENLLVLCAVCHKRSEDDEWDRLTLRAYKHNPWIQRYRSQLDGSPRAIVELKLDLSPEQFGDQERGRVIAAVAAALDICPREAVILTIRPGSIVVKMELPADSVEALRKDKQREKKVRELLAPIKLTEMTFGQSERSPIDSRVFSEANTVEKMIIDAARRVGWDYLSGPQLPRMSGEVIIESWLRESLIKLNPEIAAQPDRADEVIYNLRACILSVHADGLVRANENFMAWLRGEKTMPFGSNGEHVPVRLVDTSQPNNNRLTVCNQWTYQAGAVEKRFDVVFLVNGLPLVIGEAKTPTRSAVTWFDGAFQVNEIYEKQVPAMFVPNVFSFASEGKLFRYGSVRMPIDMWGPWRDQENQEEGQLHHVKATVISMLRPYVVLDILQNFTLFATDNKHRRIKVICRYQQYFTTNQIIERVVKGYPKKGLIWHFQGSGKSLLMVFAAQKLRMHPKLGNPTVMIVVDRIDLDTQITATFNAADVPNMVGVATRQELQTLLGKDVRKVLITIHKFGEAGGKLNERSNIILMVDEAHRTQEGNLGRNMREALPNAFLFGLTGTPINRADRNTFWAFGADEDEKGYMSRYSFQESIRDNATLPLRFEAPEVKLKIDKAAIDEAYKQITGDLSEQDRDDLAKRAAKMAILVKNPERVRAVVNHIVKHFQTKIEPEGFKAQVVTFDRECCVLYKTVMDELIGSDASAIVMTAAQYDPPTWRQHVRDKDAEEKLLDRFRDPTDPLKFVIVTSKLLTGFDAPILQAMYLDKPMKDHNLLQAICRTNRTFGQEKTHGLIVDYIGVFDDVARALNFDEKAVQQVVSNIDELRKTLPIQVQKCLVFFPGVDRSVGGYEGLMTAQQCVPNNELRDKFAAEYSVLGKIWEALSPDPVLSPYEVDYRWLTQVYESVKPPSGNGRLLWHALGAKTVELINENVHVESVRDDVDTLVMDAQVLEEILKDAEPDKRARELEIKVIARLRKHVGIPKFTDLGERLERIKERHEQGVLSSLQFLKEILEIAKEVVEAEKVITPEEERNRAKEALTDLFTDAKGNNTHIIVERIVTDIDDIVKKVRFPDWQHTSQGERLVQRELRRTLLKYKLHTDQELFDKAYAYIRQYY